MSIETQRVQFLSVVTPPDYASKEEGALSWQNSGCSVLRVMSTLSEDVSCTVVGQIRPGETYGKIVALLKESHITSHLVRSEEEPSADNLQPCQFEGVSFVHIDGSNLCYPDVVDRVIELAQKNEAMISLDLANVNLVKDNRERFENVIKKVDVLFGNLKEMKALTKLSKERDICESFKWQQAVIVTNGSRGCWAKARGESSAQFWAAQKISSKQSVVDKTGAGDFFVGGVLYGFTRAPHGLIPRKTFANSVDFGHLMAAEVIQCVGIDLSQKSFEKLSQKRQSLFEQ